ncbi:STAS domain-containing protein [Desulfovibrio desulfuricans]|uniref:STAS domain-containing protein n=1 Tax=Desulfovibrio desulfuricans TaxID=876 RepID=A0A4P7ULZ3_DESDE|nr:STAS domain-containing protein [Desulfovibrio desulfuricans]QCC85711.1 STAS domain-containing protein [Desulfovibrio desulfuricans]
MFELKAESHTGVTVLRYSGNLLLGDVAQFSKLLEDHLLASGIRQVVLDLSRVEKVDTSGLGVLVSASTKGRGRGRRLVLLMPAPHVAELLRKAEIEGFFPTFESEEELKGYIPATAE